MNIQNQQKEVTEIILSGDKLMRVTNDLDLVARFGNELYKKNRNFIKGKVKDNWFIIIEPMSGILFASTDQLDLYNYAQRKYPDRLFYSVGLLKENLMSYAGAI